jgi:hypothetical protein
MGFSFVFRMLPSSKEINYVMSTHEGILDFFSQYRDLYTVVLANHRIDPNCCSSRAPVQGRMPFGVHFRPFGRTGTHGAYFRTMAFTKLHNGLHAQKVPAIAQSMTRSYLHTAQ